MSFVHRLVLKNLKQESHLNTISTLDKNKIWMPRVVYSNTEKKDESSTDDKAFVTIARKGQFESSKSESLYNTHIFRGKTELVCII